MIKISCDDCEQTFEAPPEMAGGKMPCPHCGDMNRVPVEESPEATSGAPGDASPPAEARREEELTVVRPAMFRAHPLRYLLIVVLLIGGLVGAIAAYFAERVGSWVAWPSLAVTLAAAVWFIGWWGSSHFWRKLVVSNKRTVRHEGIVTRHTTEVLHDHVRSVDIRQTFVQRMFGVGSIGIDSAGQDGIEIEMHDIPRPYEVKKIIDRYRKM